LAQSCTPNAESRWHAYRQAYQILPDEAMMVAQAVRLTQPLEAILSQPEARVVCVVCGEEVMNEREVMGENGRVLCRSCAGERYYQ
jgi:formylmethanofuran dehydrogenase subunit E